MAGPVERLDAETVADEEQALTFRVPDGEREHAAEIVHAVVAPLFVGVDDRLGVGMRTVAMAARFEIAANAGVVVDFAVEDHPDRSVFIRQRLLSGPQIDDAQAAVGERRVFVDVEARFIRAAMRDDVAHLDRASMRVGSELRARDKAGNAAHVRPPPFRACALAAPRRRRIAGTRARASPGSTAGDRGRALWTCVRSTSCGRLTD